MQTLEQTYQDIALLCSDVPSLAHTWRFGLGEVYALAVGLPQHKERGTYTVHDAPQHVAQCVDVTEQLRSGQLVDPVWLSGFHFNSALMRIDAFYERSLRSLVPECQNSHPAVIPELRSKPYDKPHLLGQYILAKVVDVRFLGSCSFKRAKLAAIHQEVIRLKHDVEGQLGLGLRVAS